MTGLVEHQLHAMFTVCSLVLQVRQGQSLVQPLPEPQRTAPSYATAPAVQRTVQAQPPAVTAISEEAAVLPSRAASPIPLFHSAPSRSGGSDLFDALLMAAATGKQHSIVVPHGLW